MVVFILLTPVAGGLVKQVTKCHQVVAVPLEPMFTKPVQECYAAVRVVLRTPNIPKFVWLQQAYRDAD